MTAPETEALAFKKSFEAVSKVISSDLVGCSILLQRLLGAVDLFPDGGLSEGHYAEQAIRRYWLLWMPLLHKQKQQQQAELLAAPSLRHLIIPPLDIQWAWYVHRLNPIKYLEDCTAAFGAPVHPIDGLQALGFVAALRQPQQKLEQQHQQGDVAQEGAAAWLSQCARRGEVTLQVWEEMYPSGPDQLPEHQLWPPAPAPPFQTTAQSLQTQTLERSRPQAEAPAPSTRPPVDSTAEQKQTANADTAPQAPDAADRPSAGSLASVRVYVLGAMGRQKSFLHHVIRTPYTHHTFLETAFQRYLRFLALAANRRPHDPMYVPMYDIDLLWHTHLALTGAYLADCGKLLPPPPASVTAGTEGLEGVDADAAVSGGGGKRMLGHDDGLTGEGLRLGYENTMERYETFTGLVYNVGPTQRLSTEEAHPLVSQLWPLVAVLSAVSTPNSPAVTATSTTSTSRKGTRVRGHSPPQFKGPSLPSPRQITSELTATMRLALRQKRQLPPLPTQHHQHQHPPSIKSYFTSRLTFRLPSRRAKAERARAGGSGHSAGWVQRAYWGSPAHLARSGVFAFYGLWYLARGLGVGETPTTAATATAAVRREQPGGGVGGSGDSLGGSGASGGGFVGRATSALFRGVGKLRYGGGAAWEATVDGAVSYMTQQMLLLVDPAHPTSPLLSSLHPFWSDLMPMIPNTPQSPPIPSSSSASPQPPTPSLPPRPSQSAPDRPRHPTPPPPLDLPAEYFPTTSRNGAGVYLAPTHYSAATWVAYTPSDFCVLGRGRWCLPPDLSSEIVEDEARETAVNDLYYADSIDPYGNSDDGNVTCCDDKTAKKGTLHGCGTAAMSSNGRGAAARGAASGATRGGLQQRPVGPGSHPDNMLGEVVFSAGWRRRLARCYGVIYKEMMRRGRVSG